MVGESSLFGRAKVLGGDNEGVNGDTLPLQQWGLKPIPEATG